MAMTAGARITRAKIAANVRWSQEPDRLAATAPGRRAAENRFAKLVDPNNEMSEHDRAVRAEAARRAHFLRMASKSAQVRRAKSARLA